MRRTEFAGHPPWLSVPRLACRVGLTGPAYRIVQEAVSNAVRHSTAKTITINIEIDRAGWLAVVVANDGIGPKATATTTRGFGLIGMRERVEAYGGTLDYGPEASGTGWSVRARLPHDTIPSTDRGPEEEPR